MNRTSAWAALLTAASAAMVGWADVFTDQQPVSGGGTMRWSQLWVDPGPNENDLDTDAICWEDFVLAAPSSINHIEWWGVGACELGFRIDVWPQDPGTIAYQPLGVFDVYGHSGLEPAARITVTNVQTSPGPGGITKYSVDLPTPISLAANDASNPRWFIAIIGRTSQYAVWNWARGTGGSTRTFQWIRGYHRFFQLPEGRALVLSGTTSCRAAGVEVPPADAVVCRSGTAVLSTVGSGSGPLGYQWEIEDPGQPGAWVPLSDLSPIGGMVFSGSGSADLSVSPEGVSMPVGVARFRCEVSNACGSASSSPASLVVCGADFNCDGFTDFFDFDDYVNAFEAGDPAADVDGDGFIDFFDLDTFVGMFEAGC
ncbi:MAG: hypothetical protein HRU70_05845 [Phycisphaeraceae bacterium]|nr:MAG: hypothetical protein HRU70_05845 [Phycisphaeraceae bacterium]